MKHERAYCIIPLHCHYVNEPHKNSEIIIVAVSQSVTCSSLLFINYSVLHFHQSFLLYITYLQNRLVGKVLPVFGNIAVDILVVKSNVEIYLKQITFSLLYETIEVDWAKWNILAIIINNNNSTMKLYEMASQYVDNRSEDLYIIM